MAETLGTIATILQLIDTALTAREYMKGFVNAPVEQRELFSDMAALEPLFLELRNRVQSNPSRKILQQIATPLIKFKTAMEDLVEKIRPALENSSAWSKFSNRVAWSLYNKKATKSYLEVIENMKSLLNTWLILDIWDVTQQQQFEHEGETALGILTSVKSAEHKQHAAERQKIIDWITSQNFFQRQADIHNAWQPGTGEWFLAHPHFKKWDSGSGTILWCNGMPGAGKTVLASMVVNHLRTRFQKTSTNTGVACMYLNHKETETQTLASLLAGLWTQLIVEKPIPIAIFELYNHHRERSTRPSADEVHVILRDCAVTQYSKVYFIVDAVDEYPEDLRGLLLEKLGAMGPTVNVLITSRPHVNLAAFFPNLQTVEIRATEDDICRYVDTQILKSYRLLKHVETRPELRDEIRSRVIGGVDGMFLLAKLHLVSLGAKSTIKAVRDALRQLPKDLTLTYEEAMARIDRQSEEDSQIAQLTLTWVANAKRPLLVAELQEALAIETGTKALDEDNILDIDIILSVCAGLVIVDEIVPVVRLIHYTMQHYMDSVRESRFPNASTDITSRLLTYLSFKQFDELQSKDAENLLLENPLLAYSQYLLLHAAGEPEQRLREKVVKFLDEVPKWRHLWDYMHHRLDYEAAPPWNYPTLPEATSPLWISAASNLVYIARFLLANSNVKINNLPVLHVAAYYGHIPMVQLLLDNGADVEFRDARTRATAMQVASERGHESIVQLFIESNADVNAGGGEYETALQAAACAGHDAVADLLLQNGADAKLQGGAYGTALQAAASRGHSAVAQRLIDYGADVNAQGGRYGNALRGASYQAHPAMIRLLIKNNADVNFHGAFGTALDVALYWGHHEVAQLLVENGADVNMQRGEHGFGTALHTAAYERNVVAVQWLLAHGADVNLKDGQYGTSLQVASYRGHEAVVRLLIDHGADVNTVGGCFGTALRAGSCQGHDDIVQLLIESGAEIRFQAEGHPVGTVLPVTDNSESLTTPDSSALDSMVCIDLPALGSSQCNYRKTTKTWRNP
ncbi:ankyrin repeat-containing domain protein [Mycena galericulata]|nr:ankyrin repeat-containing domain protein [Mycena galericulata]